MRNKSIDLMKIFAIILVVVGHSIQFSIVDFDNNFFFKLIYAIHMPFFFFLSGYVSSLVKIEAHCTYQYCIQKKAINLMIPFLTFTIINFFLQDNEQSLYTYLVYVFRHIDESLWFLIVLFQIFIFVYVSIMLSSYIKKYLDIKISYRLILFLVIIMIPVSKSGGLYLVKYYLFYFLFGAMIKYINNIEIKNIPILFLLSIAYIILVYSVWSRTGENFLVIYSIKIPIAVLGILVLFNSFQIILNKEFENTRIFEFFSQNTLGIYALHFYFILYIIPYFLINLNMPTFSLILFKSIFSIMFSLIIIWFIRKNKLLKLIFLGIKDIKIKGKK